MANYPKLWQRLTVMGRAELTDRLRQSILARADFIRYRCRYDFGRQLGKVSPKGRFFFSCDQLPEIADAIKSQIPGIANDIVARANRICEHRFDLLGYENLEYGAGIDWHLDAVHGRRAPKIPWYKIRYLDFKQCGDAKVIWELNRQQHLVVLAKAYVFTGEPKFAREILKQWEHWWENNPYPVGINWASSLEVALRVQSWIWTFFLLQSSPLFSADVYSQWMSKLLVCGRHIENHLSTYFSPNTHLLGEALALFSLGTLFSSSFSERWRIMGWETLLREACKQVRDDGFYFEQSTYYHVYALDMFLHASVLAEVNGTSIPAHFSGVVRRMLDALFMLGRAGVPPMLGDDDGGRLFDPARNRAVHMLDPLATGAVLYQRPAYKALIDELPEETLWLLGSGAVTKFQQLAVERRDGDSAALPASGFYFMFSPGSKQQLQIDAGPLGAGSGGHGHADALSISLIRDRRVLLRDSGTFEYVGPGPERKLLRGNAAHNTVQIDARDAPQTTGPFSWADLPETRVERWISGKHFDLFQGSHLHRDENRSVVHRRAIFRATEEIYFVRDTIEGHGEHQIDIHWHLSAEQFRVSEEAFVFSNGDASIAFVPCEDPTWAGGVSQFHWSPVYGLKENGQVLRFSSRQQLPAEFLTVLEVGANSRGSRPTLERMGDVRDGQPRGYRYLNNAAESTIIFVPKPGIRWRLAAWRSDAEIMNFSHDHESHIRRLVLCKGSYLDIGENRVLSCSRPVDYVEVIANAGVTRVLSSAPQDVKIGEAINLLWEDSQLAAPAPTERD